MIIDKQEHLDVTQRLTKLLYPKNDWWQIRGNTWITKLVAYSWIEPDITKH